MVVTSVSNVTLNVWRESRHFYSVQTSRRMRYHLRTLVLWAIISECLIWRLQEENFTCNAEGRTILSQTVSRRPPEFPFIHLLFSPSHGHNSWQVSNPAGDHQMLPYSTVRLENLGRRQEAMALLNGGIHFPRHSVITRHLKHHIGENASQTRTHYFLDTAAAFP